MKKHSLELTCVTEAEKLKEQRCKEALIRRTPEVNLSLALSVSLSLGHLNSHSLTAPSGLSFLFPLVFRHFAQ